MLCLANDIVVIQLYPPRHRDESLYEAKSCVNLLCAVYYFHRLKYYF